MTDLIVRLEAATEGSGKFVREIEVVFLSNERPWSMTYSSGTHAMTNDEAVVWAERMQEGMGDAYRVTLKARMT